MIKILSLFLITAAFLFSHGNALACTIFNRDKGDSVLVGNNEDGNYSTDVEIWFIARSRKGYGRIFLGGNSYFSSDKLKEA